jgi:hypothetical protein
MNVPSTTSTLTTETPGYTAQINVPGSVGSFEVVEGTLS